MAGSVNKVILVGNLGSDPEVKSFSNGGRICNIRIATSENWTDRASGERKERTEWHSVVIRSDGLIGIAERYLRKGSKVYLEGSLSTRKWQDSNGQDRYSTEVVLNGPGAVMTMLDGPKDDTGNGQSRSSGSSTRGQADEPRGGTYGGGASRFDDDDDDIPFLRSDGIF